MLNHYRYVLGNPAKHGANGIAKCYYDGLVRRRMKGGQDMYPGLQRGGSAATDKEIDRLVYDLYGLSDDEIAMVKRNWSA